MCEVITEPIELFLHRGHAHDVRVVDSARAEGIIGSWLVTATDWWLYF